MSAPSLAPFVNKRPWLQKWVKPLANWYANAAGYRQLGLRYAFAPKTTNLATTCLSGFPATSGSAELMS